MEILLTNDDGIQAVGIRSLYKALIDAGHNVTCVAPLSEMSAVGHAITFLSPLRIKEFTENGFRGWAVSGTPADCVKMALGSDAFDFKPDVVVSGINAGANVGIDILYSGTVSAATEGALLGYPSVAVSFDGYVPGNLAEQAEYAAGFISKRPWDSLPPRSVLNMNFPAIPVSQTKGLKLCRQTSTAYEDHYGERLDPRGRPYYWLEGEIPEGKLSPDTDRALLSKGYITLTPLKFDFTDRDSMKILEQTLDIQ